MLRTFFALIMMSTLSACSEASESNDVKTETIPSASSGTETEPRTAPFEDSERRYSQSGGKTFFAKGFGKSVTIPEGFSVGGEFGGEGLIEGDWIIVKPSYAKTSTAVRDDSFTVKVRFTKDLASPKTYSEGIKANLSSPASGYSGLRKVRETYEEYEHFVEMRGAISKSGKPVTILEYGKIGGSVGTYVSGFFDDDNVSEGKKAFSKIAQGISDAEYGTR